MLLCVGVKGSECCKTFLFLLLAFSAVCFMGILFIACMCIFLDLMSHDIEFYHSNPQSKLSKTTLTRNCSSNVQYHAGATCCLDCHLGSGTILSDTGIIALQEVNRMLVILDISDTSNRLVIS